MQGVCFCGLARLYDRCMTAWGERNKTDDHESRLKALERMLEDQTSRTVSSASDRGRSTSRAPGKRLAPSADQAKSRKQKVVFSKDTKAEGTGKGVLTKKDDEPPCTYPGCAGQDKAMTHCRRDCRTEKRDKKAGLKVVRMQQEG